MPGTNGHGDVLCLGDLTPRTRRVEILRDGQLYVLQGYVYGPRTPGRIKVQIDSHRTELIAKIADLVDPAPLDDAADDSAKFKYMLANDRNSVIRNTAHIEFVESVLGTLIVGLEQNEAVQLAGDEDHAKAVLQELGFYRPEDGVESAPEAHDDTPLTMPESLPTSAPSGSRRRKRSTSQK
jgi:hypothetical protein